MKAITVLQPWATLLITGASRYAVRSWQTSYRGPLLIHAGRRLVTHGPYRAALQTCAFLDRMPRGCILGFAELTDCLPVEAVAEPGLGDTRPGAWAWRLERPTRLARPLPLRGVLGVYEVPDDFLEAHLSAEEHALLHGVCP